MLDPKEFLKKLSSIRVSFSTYSFVDKFKGSKGYYQRKDGTVLDLSELLKEEASTALVAHNTNHSGNVLSEEDLARITDRSEESYRVDHSDDSDKFSILHERKNEF